MKHEIYFERKFYLDNKTGYWISCIRPTIRAHTWVWKQHHGYLPKGFHVHHIDENKSNNNIENLELINVSSYFKWEEKNPISKNCKFCGKQFETKIYHKNVCSNLCKSARRRKMKVDIEKRACPICNVIFEVYKYAKTKTCGKKCGLILASQKY